MGTAHTTERMTGAARREQILDVTEEIVDAAGFHAVSIDRVAREAGITRPVVYTHFGDREGLLHALVDRGNQRTLAALARIVPTSPGGDPADVLLGSLERYLETVREDPATWRLALLPPESAPDLLGERIARDRANVVRALVAVVEPWLGGDADPVLVARSLVAIAEESARVVLEEPSRATVERILANSRWLFSRLG
jgi:AcrR family transcriptional regulator